MSQRQAGVAVTFTENMKLTMKKVNFLANSTNKQQFINMLGNYLENICRVYHAPEDADVLIVQKSVESATLMDTALAGGDTDLLILLCYHASLDSHNKFFSTKAQEKCEEAQSVEHRGCQGATRS